MTRPWKDRIQLKDLLSEDDSDSNAQYVGKEFAKRLRKHPWAELNPAVAEIADEFELAGDAHIFNYVLDRLYDEADAGRVWIS